MEDQVDKDKEDKEEENEILEESPCKRWSKRCEKVKQRDVPGIDAAYLAMDNETGNEVVWNEVLFSERKNLRDQEERIRSVFDNLTRLEHPNLVKFHKYWIDTKSDKPRIIFITEYMSSGSISRFLQRARSSGTLLSIKAWKNWNRQILSALSYLHSCDPPIVHANLSCNTIFIQQNGLVKIGCVAPKTIHHHVKTFRENIKNIHYLAPEYDHLTEPTTQADIYSFGVCALEMATTGALQSGHLNGGSGGACTSDKNASANATGQSGDGGPTVVAAGGGGGGGFHIVTEEMLRKALDTLEDPEQKEFIERSMEHDPAKRANVAELLSRLGPAEPEKHDETSLDEDGFIEMERQQQRRTSPPHEQSPVDRATSPQETAPNIDAAAPMANSAETLPPIQQNMPKEPSSFPAPTSNGGASTTTIPSSQQQPAAPNNVAHHNLSSQQNGYYNTQCAATTTISTHACATASTTATAVSATTLSTQSQTNTNCTMSSGAGTAAGITSSSTSTNTTSSATALLSTASSAPQSQVQLQQNSMAAASAPDEGYHTTQSMVDHHTTTGTSTPLSAELAAAAAAANSMSSLQYRETRQILEMHAEVLDGQQLRVQLQLDDQMHRQLTGPLRAEDTAETLAAELVQHGFVSEANSKGIFDLLTNLLAEHRRKELELATRREFGESGGQNSQQQQHSGSNSNPSSAHQSPKHHPATGGGNGGKALDTTTLPNNIASDQKTTANAVTTTASAVAPNGAATPRPP